MPDAELPEMGSGSVPSTASHSGRAESPMQTEIEQQQRRLAKHGEAAAEHKEQQQQQQQQLPPRLSMLQPVINTAPSPAQSPSLSSSSSSSTPASASASGFNSLSSTQSLSSLPAAARPSQHSPLSVSSKAQDLLFGGQKHNAEHNKLCDMLGISTREFHTVEQQMDRQRHTSHSGSSQHAQQQDSSKSQDAASAADSDAQPSPVSSRRQSVVVSQSKAMDLLHGGHKADGHKVSDRLGISWHEMQRAHQQHKDTAGQQQQEDAVPEPAAPSTATSRSLPASISPTSAAEGSPVPSSGSPPPRGHGRQQSISRKAADLLYGSVKSASKVEDRLGVREKEIDTFAQCQKAYQLMGIFDTRGDAKDGKAAVIRERAGRGGPAEAAAARAGKGAKARAATASAQQDWPESGTISPATAEPLSQSLRREQSLSTTVTSLARNISLSQVPLSPQSQRSFRTPSNGNALLAAAAANTVPRSPSASRHNPLSRHSSTASIEILTPRTEPDTPELPSAALGAVAAWRRKATLQPLGAAPQVPRSPALRSSREAATAGSKAGQAATGSPMTSPAQQRSTERANRLRSKVKVMGMVSAWQRRTVAGAATVKGAAAAAAGGSEAGVPATPPSARARRLRTATPLSSSPVVTPGPASMALQLGVSGRAISTRPMRGMTVEEETKEEALEERTADSLRSPLLSNRRTTRVPALAPIKMSGRLTAAAAIH